MKKKAYMNPYIAGVLLGLALLAAMYLSGRGLGASGGIKNIVVAAVQEISPRHAADSPYYAQFAGTNEKPLRNWLSFEILGVLIGGIISGAFSGRLNFKIEKPQHVSTGKRLLFAFLGGAFFVYGAQLARGCTSGGALSGMAVLSTAGFVTMMSIFGSAYLFAWFFRKLWI
jgi:hypothetical protein